MPIVTPDVHEGGGTLEDGPKGYIQKRRFIVDGITGDPSEIEYLALVQDGVPKRGDAHPKMGFLFCYHRQTRPLSTGQVEVICTYGQVNQTLLPPSDKQKGQIQIGASVHDQDTNIDANGNVMVVSYTKKDTNPDGTFTGTETTVKQPGTVKKAVPSYTLGVSRRENGAPTAKALYYTGTVNSTNFAGASPGQFLCTGIRAKSQDGGVTFDVDYEFQYNPNGWTAIVAYIDPSTNTPPEDVSFTPGVGGNLGTGNGMAEFNLYQRTDFSQLSLV